LFGRLSHRAEATAGVLLLQAPKQVGSFAQAVCGTACIGRTGILRDGALHVFISLAQTIKRLLGCLLPTVGGLLGGLLRISLIARLTTGAAAGGCAARLPAALARLSTALP
jgi:hypothetical protein